MPLITCYAKLNFYFSDLRSLLSRRDTDIVIKVSFMNDRTFITLQVLPWDKPSVLQEGNVDCVRKASNLLFILF